MDTGSALASVPRTAVDAVDGGAAVEVAAGADTAVAC
jgi:hypothetical protein